ncbi:MAG: alpha/beta fold hydrolase [Lentisphaeria bacterium]|nr:alpha/beta fold hydrolase [Lentisphaeria bacterium]
MKDKKKFVSSEYRFRSNYINIQGHDFHYIDEGSGDPVLLIHGGITWSYFYRNLIPSLAEHGNRVLAPDLMGFGFSDHSRKFDYSLQNQVAVLTEFVEQLDLNNITLVFHGMGMLPALGLAINLPSRFKQIISLNGIAFTTPSFYFLRILKHIPILSKLFISNSNFLLKLFYNKFRRSISKQAMQDFLFPYYNYKSRIAANAFLQDAPFLHRASSHELVNNILDNLDQLSELEWYLINANLTPYMSHRELRKNRKVFHWATFVNFPEESHFMLECKDSHVIKYLRKIVK